MRSTTRWAAFGAGLLLTTTTACSSGGGGTDVESDPTTALSEAVEALGDYDGVELTFELDGDREAIIGSEEGLDERTADLLLDSSLVLRAAGQDQDDAQAEFVVNLAGDAAVEVRVLPEQQFFLRVDLDAISTAIDDPEFSSGIDQIVTGAEQFGLGEVATAAQSGDWIQLAGVEQLAELAGGATAETTEEPSEEEVEDVRQRIVDTVQGFVDEDVELTYVGEESAGERVTATTTEAALAGLFEDISSIATELSGVDPEALGDLPEAEGSDRPVEVDFWIDGGQLRQIGYDISQMEGAEGPPEDTFVLVAIEEFGGSVEAPSDATEIDLFAIIGQMFGGGMPGAGGDIGELGDLGDPATDDGAADGADVPAGDVPAGDECIPQEMVDQALEEEGGDSLQSAIDQGLITIC